jgi:hypothetical protein
MRMDWKSYTTTAFLFLFAMVCSGLTGNEYELEGKDLVGPDVCCYNIID